MEKTIVNLYNDILGVLYSAESAKAKHIVDIIFNDFNEEVNERHREAIKCLLIWLYILKRNNFTNVKISSPLYIDGDYVYLRDLLIISTSLSNMYDQLNSEFEPDQKTDTFVYDFVNRAIRKFVGENKGILLYEENTEVDSSQFAPLFKYHGSKTRYLRWLIDPLFKSIISLGVNINHNSPRIIDLNKNKLLLQTACSKPISYSEIADGLESYIEGPLFDLINEDWLYNKDNVDSMANINYDTFLSLSWPYNIGEGGFLDNKAIKRKLSIRLSLKKRFNLKDEILPGAILFHPNEVRPTQYLRSYQDIPDVFHVIKTVADNSIQQKLTELKYAWKKEVRANRFSTSPLKWLTMISDKRTVDEWKQEFRSCFSNVSNDTIRLIEDLIRNFHQINWFRSFVKDNIPTEDILYVLLPKHHIYDEPNRSIKQLLNEICGTKQICFINSEELFDCGSKHEVWILDHNVNILSNIPSHINAKIIMPDFSYAQFGLFVPYILMKKEKEVVLSNVRMKVIPGFAEELIEKIKQIESRVLHNLRCEIKKYRVPIKDTEIEESIEEYQPEEDSSEIVDRFYEQRRHKRQSSSVTTREVLTVVDSNNEIYRLQAREKVLVKFDGQIVHAQASELENNDEFTTYKHARHELSRLNELFENMTDFPRQAKHWKRDLSKISNGYATLGSMLKDKEFIRRSWYENAWIDEQSTIALPREKQHWKSICQLLGYPETTCNRAWYHLKLHFLNSVKDKILNSFFADNNSSAINDPIERLVPILREHMGDETEEGIKEAAYLLKKDLESKIKMKTIIDLK
jgi:hypothetical protein